MDYDIQMKALDIITIKLREAWEGQLVEKFSSLCKEALVVGSNTKSRHRARTEHEQQAYFELNHGSEIFLKPFKTHVESLAGLFSNYVNHDSPSFTIKFRLKYNEYEFSFMQARQIFDRMREDIDVETSAGREFYKNLMETSNKMCDPNFLGKLSLFEIKMLQSFVFFLGCLEYMSEFNKEYTLVTKHKPKIQFKDVLTDSQKQELSLFQDTKVTDFLYQ